MGRSGSFTIRRMRVVADNVPNCPKRSRTATRAVAGHQPPQWPGPVPSEAAPTTQLAVDADDRIVVT